MASLAETFLAETLLTPSLGAMAPSVLAQAIEKAEEQARSTMPTIGLDIEAFARWIAQRLPESDDPLTAMGQLHTSDLYLACACAHRIEAAIELFEQQCIAAIPPAIKRVDPSASFAHDVQAELRVKLLVGDLDREHIPRIVGYAGRGPLRSWVQVAAIRTAWSLKRADANAPIHEEDALLEAPWCEDDSELSLMRRESRALLREALTAAIASLEERERAVLRLYLLEDVSSDAIGKMYRVHRATVARWISGSHDKVLSHVRRHLMRQAGMSTEEIESLLRFASSQISFSLSLLLAHPA